MITRNVCCSCLRVFRWAGKVITCSTADCKGDSGFDTRHAARAGMLNNFFHGSTRSPSPTDCGIKLVMPWRLNSSMTWRSDSASEAFRGMSSKLRPPEFDGSGGGGDRVSDEEDEKGRDNDRDDCRAPLADLRPCHRRDFMSITTRPLWLATYSADALLLDFIFTRMDPSSKRSRKISKQIKESISKGAGDWLAWPPFKFRTKDAACVFVCY